jgi:hypothetical protein
MSNHPRRMAMLSAALPLAGFGLAFAHRLVRGFDLRRHRFDLFGRDILGTRTSAAVRAPSSNPSAVPPPATVTTPSSNPSAAQQPSVAVPATRPESFAASRLALDRGHRTDRHHVGVGRRRHRAAGQSGDDRIAAGAGLEPAHAGKLGSNRTGLANHRRALGRYDRHRQRHGSRTIPRSAPAAPCRPIRAWTEFRR